MVRTIEDPTTPCDVATLPCVTNINVRKQATSDKLQGIVNM